MPCRCIVYGCRGNFSDGPKVRLFSFPSDEELRKKWLKVLPLKHDTISKSTKVCELHFKESDFIKEISAYDHTAGKIINFKLDVYRLKKGVVPSRFSDYVKINSENFKGYLKKHQSVYETKTVKKDDKEEEVEEQYKNSFETGCNQGNCSNQSTTVWGKDELSALIALYELEQCLYDKKDRHYYSKQARNSAYHRIQQVIINLRPHCTVSEIKRKIHYLRTKYTNERRLKVKAISNGCCTEETYKASLWCFKLLYFLEEHIKQPESYDKKMLTAQTQHESSKHSSEVDKECENVLDNSNENIEIEDDEDEQCQILIQDSTASYDTIQNNSECPTNENYINDNNLRLNKSNKRKQDLPLLTSKKINLVENMHVSQPDKEEIFGQYVAEELKTFKDKPILYVKTKQLILQILTKANYEIENFNCT